MKDVTPKQFIIFSVILVAVILIFGWNKDTQTIAGIGVMFGWVALMNLTNWYSEWEVKEKELDEIKYLKKDLDALESRIEQLEGENRKKD